MVHPSNCNLDDMILTVFQLCTWRLAVCRAKVLPVFTPTEHLLKKATPETPEWEVYAEAVREVMCEHGKLKKTNMTFPEYIHYWNYLQFKTDDYTFREKKVQ